MSDRRYVVDKLIGPTLHAHGAHAGRACVTLELGTDGERYTATQLRDRVSALDTCNATRLCMSGAGWDAELAATIRGAGFRVHAEIDGTAPLAGPVDWLVVAPRAGAAIIDGLQVDEVHVDVDAAITEDALDRHAARWRCEHYFLRGDPARIRPLIFARPRWRLSPAF